MTLRMLNFGSLALALTAGACTASIDQTATNGGSGGGAGVGTGGSSAGAGGSIVDPKSGLKIDGKPAYYRVARLTNEQWTHTVQNVLALTSPPTDAEGFQNAVSGLNDFSNNEQLLGIDKRGWTDRQAAAEALAAQAASDPAQLARIYPGTDGPGFIAAVGRRFYRRPLTAVETASYQKLFDSGASYSGAQSAFAKGASVVLEAMLQSPYFLYRTELGAAGAPLSSYEMASKLSLWLRNTAPDDALLDAAAGPGQLDTPAGAAALAQTMLEEAGAKAVMRRFHGEFLHLAKFAELTKEWVENYNPALSTELGESSYLFFDKIFSQGLGVKDIFLSKSGFVGPLMAPFYEGNIAAPVSGFAERELSGNRLGYFMQLPFLMLNSRPDGPDPIHRGVSMSLEILCAPLGFFGGELPPLPPRLPGQTNRDRVDQHTNVCGAACHNNMINPLGFAFENYDGMGQYREKEVNGDTPLTIDASGSFAFVDGTKSYNNAADLMNVLANGQQAHLCYSKKLASYGLQRDLVEADLPLVSALASVSTAPSGSVKQIMVDLVKQDAFRVRSGGAK